MKTARVIDCKFVEKSKKLLQFTLDCGEAGPAPYFPAFASGIPSLKSS